MTKAKHFFKPPFWYGNYIDANAWRSINYASIMGNWQMHGDWQQQLSGEYVYYIPHYVVLKDEITQNNTTDLRDAGFAKVCYMDTNAVDSKIHADRTGTKKHRIPAKDLRIIRSVLQADKESKIMKDYEAKACMVITPRASMLSPWAGKTQDVLRSCGVDTVPHLERGRLISLKEYHSLPVHKRAELRQGFYDAVLEELWDYNPNAIVAHGIQMCGMLNYIPTQDKGYEALSDANQKFGLSLNEAEMQYLHNLYKKWERNITDAELVMFAQLNSEHCRHKIFNAQITNAGDSPDSLFGMIKNTAKKSPKGIDVAYVDNAAVIHGYPAELSYINTKDKHYRSDKPEPAYWTLKVETHNHPTAISPFAGAGTGIGGEIRDEIAVGRGAHSVMGMSGYSTSYLCIPNHVQPWEAQFDNRPKPAAVRSALDIMLIAPIGAAAFANEYGRPNLCGYFRSFEARSDGKHYGYHKPIMIAGGAGKVLKENIRLKSEVVNSKEPLKIIVLGGPALLIGIGGGTASSRVTDAEDAPDQGSVQRQDPQMQRRCQEVVNRCAFLKDANPIERIHDVGGGGLANAIPELLRELKRGALIDLNAIPSADPSLSPMELWCNESQERFVLAIKTKNLKRFDEICTRERCPYGVVGTTDNSQILHVRDKQQKLDVVKMPLKDLFSEAARANITFQNVSPAPARKQSAKDRFSKLDFVEALYRVMSHPTVASKDFLINIADRSVGGLVCRDQMVGRWQVAVADSAVSCADYTGYSGVAMAVGERTPLAVQNPLAATRMAVGEALTNIASNAITDISDIKLSVNWMAASDDANERAKLMHAVRDLGMHLCPELGVAVVVGKDSLFMHTRWNKRIPEHRRVISHEVISPLSVIVTASAPLRDVRQCMTPEFKYSHESRLFLIDLGRSKNRMNGSCFSECLVDIMGQENSECPTLDDPADMRAFMQAMYSCYSDGLILAYHDRSDGGLIACVLEMCFASRFGTGIHLEAFASDYEDMLRILFSEELGAVVQVAEQHIEKFMGYWKKVGLADHVHDIGACEHVDSQSQEGRISQLVVFGPDGFYYAESLSNLYNLWCAPSLNLRVLRDQPDCIAEEKAEEASEENYNTHSGAFFALTFDYDEEVLLAPSVNLTRPRLALLREQGTNGHHEMAAAFDRAQFEVVDVRVSDICDGTVSLKQFQGMAVAGGFSYGDVLGAGRGWAQSVLWNKRARDEFEAFFARPEIFTLGVCNGCQMLSALRELIPGTDHWPEFNANLSGQFEARLAMVHILESSSVFMNGMANAFLPIPIAHGEGRACLDEGKLHALISNKCVSMRYAHNMRVAYKYPYNPTGSMAAIAGVNNEDGRIMIMMPHPERVFRAVQYSWKPDMLGESSPWIRMFCNARHWVASN